MKNTHFLLLLLCLSASPLLSQSPAFCDDLLTRAKTELKKKDYSKSRDYCEAALPLCPDFTDRFAKVLDEVNTAIEAEKKKAKDGEQKAKAALEQVEREKKATEAERKKAEDNFLLAQEKTKEAEKEAENARRALDEQKKAVAAQQVALANVVRLTLKEAEKKIYTLDYEAALDIIQSAAALQAAPEEVSDALLEIAFFFAETGKFDRARGILDTVATLAGDLSTFKKLTNLNTRSGLRKAIKTLSPDRDTFLATRYFPTMMPIPGGTDTLGSNNDGDDEKPRHVVTLAPFKMAKTETTWWQYNLFCEATDREIPEKPAGWGGEGDNPVINVNWYDAVEYANWLNKKEGRDSAIVKTGSGDDDFEIKLKSNGYRLPTEAEWEYAARAHTPYIYAGADEASINDVAWYGDNSGSRTHPAARKKANAFGLNDMSGNVWEWCWDWYGKYDSEAKLNPTGPEKGDYRVARGGSRPPRGDLPRIGPHLRHADAPRHQYGLPPFPPVRRVAIRALIMRKKKESKKRKGRAKAGSGATLACPPFLFLREGIAVLCIRLSRKNLFLKKVFLLKRGSVFARIKKIYFYANQNIQYPDSRRRSSQRGYERFPTFQKSHPNGAAVDRRWRRSFVEFLHQICRGLFPFPQKRQRKD
jgi:formylglycine-generating enzyme required for sulfatase activity